jgi:hypothetical protein
MSFSDTFDVDTGMPPSTVGANYGQTSCPDQYLADIDLEQALQGKTVFIFGGWSSAIDGQPCEPRRVVMTVFGSNGTTWSAFDQVTFTGQTQGSVCQAVVQTHTNSSQQGLSGTRIRPADQFQHIRVAVNATLNSTKVAVALFVITQ